MILTILIWTAIAIGLFAWGARPKGWTLVSDLDHLAGRRGKVAEIIRGEVVSEVDVQTPFGIVTSVITTRSVDELGLTLGSEVVALVKSTEVSIAKL